MLNQPNIYHFNASCEMAVGNGTNSFTPPAFIKRFEQELELLPIYLTKPKDILIVERKPSNEFLNKIAKILPNPPQIHTYKELKTNKSLSIDSIKPWGWSPTEHLYMSPFKNKCSQAFKNQVNFQWNPEHRDLYSRKAANNILIDFLETSEKPELFIDKDHLPILCDYIDDIKELLEKWSSLIIKAPWSSSGRGLIVLKEEKIHSTYIKWINGVLKNQGYVMVEPRLNKVYDLSFHFEVKTKKSIDFLGQASFSTDEGGQYIGNNIQKLPLNLSPEEKEILNPENCQLIAVNLEKAIKNSPFFTQYHGVLGVDVLLYRNELDQLKLYPCMEINLRQNMGTLALKLRELMHPMAKGMWKVKHFQKQQAIKFDEKMRKEYPIIVKEERIIKGYIPLIEPQEHKNFAVYILAK